MSESLSALLAWPVKSNIIIGGNFDFHQELLDPNVCHLSGVSSFVEWTENYSLRSVLPFRASIDRAGHILDVILTNMKGLSAHVDPGTHSTSTTK